VVNEYTAHGMMLPDATNSSLVLTVTSQTHCGDYQPLQSLASIDTWKIGLTGRPTNRKGQVEKIIFFSVYRLTNLGLLAGQESERNGWSHGLGIFSWDQGGGHHGTCG
jgi:hypothetical protein